nr:MAG TPA: hypothetical protein [Bacteriophage sp.]
MQRLPGGYCSGEHPKAGILGRILGQNGLWGMIWGNKMFAFVRICL